MSGDDTSAWQRWVRHPQQTGFRKALFQVHLWSGIILGLYVLMISATGSVLVYRNELYRAATPKPYISRSSAPRLTSDQLTDDITRLYPGFRIIALNIQKNPDEAVAVRLQRQKEVRNRLFDPRSGVDLGDSVSTGIKVVSGLIDLHDNLFAGPTGREVNGLGALALLLLAATGLAIWWPGIRNWRRSLTVHGNVGWKRLVWDLHSAVGFWTFGWFLVFGLSGIYLAFPDRVQDLADWIEPQTPANITSRIGDRVIYWLAYLHFGRINGIGLPCHGRGLCDQTTKAVWATFGFAPAAMFITGAIMWWNRVVRPRWKAERRKLQHATGAQPS
jgi:uncharacterized iron-regulated membrane protein